GGKMIRFFFCILSLTVATIFANSNEEFIQSIKNNTYSMDMISDLNIRYQNKDGENFLSLAAYYGHEDLVKILIDKGLKLDFKETNGTTPLMNAAFSGYLNIVKLLATKGADINAKNIFLYTPLIKSVFKNNTDTVLFFLSKNVQVNHQDSQGNTALHYAVNYHQNPIIINELLKKSNLKLTNRNKLTAFQNAIKNNDVAVVQLFLEYDPSFLSQLTKFNDLDQLVYNLVANNRKDLLEPIFEKEGNPSAISYEGVPAIHVAISLGLCDMVTYLLEKKVSIEQESLFGDTPLTIAVYSEEFDIVNDLLQKRANINHVEKNGDTALHIAIRRKNKKITTLLLSQPNISLNIANIYGDTPFSIAKDSNDPALFMLVENSIKKNKEGKK
ncbi:MAG: ankyrin repeat domain-containing protein, partial [Brevinema sp.]